MADDAKGLPCTPSTTRTPPTPGLNPEGRIIGVLLGRFSPPRVRDTTQHGVDRRCFFHHPLLRDDFSPTRASPHPPISLARKLGAEFVGTLILVFAGTAAAIIDIGTGGAVTLPGLSAVAGLSVTILVLSIGHISGAHFNPAITIAFAALKRFPWKQVPMYVIAQMAASLCAAFALKQIFHPLMGGGVTVPSGGIMQAFVMEFIVSFNLMFVVTAVATDARAAGELAPIAVGATIALNVLLAGEVSGASMNPARTLGPAVAANNYKAIWIYFMAPICGALVGAAAYTMMKPPEVSHGRHAIGRR